jgi:hypothetical protein
LQKTRTARAHRGKRVSDRWIPSKFPDRTRAVRSDRRCEGDIPSGKVKVKSRHNQDRLFWKDAWQRSGAIGRSSIGGQVSAVRSKRRDPTTVGSMRTCKVFKGREGLITVMRIMVIWTRSVVIGVSGIASSKCKDHLTTKTPISRFDRNR